MKLDELAARLLTLHNQITKTNVELSDDALAALDALVESVSALEDIAPEEPDQESPIDSA